MAIASWTLLIWSGKHSAITQHGRSAQWHDLGHLLEWEGVQYASPAFLNQADAPLYLWHVFFCHCGIHNKDGYQYPELLKHAVH